MILGVEIMPLSWEVEAAARLKTMTGSRLLGAVPQVVAMPTNHSKGTSDLLRQGCHLTWFKNQNGCQWLRCTTVTAMLRGCEWLFVALSQAHMQMCAMFTLFSRDCYEGYEDIWGTKQHHPWSSLKARTNFKPSSINRLKNVSTVWIYRNVGHWYEATNSMLKDQL